MGELGKRPRQSQKRATILELLRLRPWRPVELAEVLGVDPKNLVERHLSPMLAERLIERVHPDRPNHPEQAYRAIGLDQKKLWD